MILNSSGHPSVTAAEVAEAVAALRRAGIDSRSATRSDVMSVCGKGNRRARTILEWIRRGSIEPEPEPSTGLSETDEQRGDERTIHLRGTRIKTLEQLVEHCQIDTTEWEIERWVCNKWEVAAKLGPKDSPILSTEPLFQIKAWLRRRPSVAVISQIVDEFQRKAERYSPAYPAIIFREPKASGNMLEISIYDHHFGALIWGRETGAADWDTGIANRCFRDALTTLLSRTKGQGIDRILLSVGNDLQNSDNRAGTTEAGTPQDNDSRYVKVCGSVQDTTVWAIEVCREVAPIVTVPIIPGNHDPLTMFHLGCYLKAWFRHCPNVEIDNSPTQRKVYQHGKVMLMLTHGKGIKPDQFPLLMATEHPRMWADTKWRETHTGHIHTRRKMIPELDEIQGVAVRSMPSLRPPCAWSADMGYVGNIRSAEAYIWNADEGLVGTATYTARP